MKPVFRHSLFALVIIAFLVSAPLIILQAQSIKLNYTWGTTRADFKPAITGIIKIDVNRLFVPISIDGKKAATYRNPATLKSLEPGWYSISISLEDFLPWQKEIYVKSGEVTHIKNVVLVPEKFEATKLLAVKNKISNVYPGVHSQDLFFISSDGPQRYDYNLSLNPDVDSLPIKPATLKAWQASKISLDNLSALSWSTDHSRLFISNTNPDKYYFWYARDAKKIISLKYLLGRDVSIKKYSWDPINANQFYFLTTDNKLYFVDFIREPALSKVSDMVTDFAISSNSIYYLKNNAHYQYLWQKHLSGLEDQKMVLQLSAKGVLKLASSKQGSLALIDTATGELGILKQRGISNQLFIEQALLTGVQNVTWSPNGERLLAKTLVGYVIYDLEGPLGVPRNTILPGNLNTSEYLFWLPDNDNFIYWNQNTVKLADANVGKPWLKQLLWSAPADNKIVSVRPNKNFRYLLIHTRSNNGDAIYHLNLSKLSI